MQKTFFSLSSKLNTTNTIYQDCMRERFSDIVPVKKLDRDDDAATYKLLEKEPQAAALLFILLSFP